MKNKIVYFILFVLLSAKTQGQISDTIFVYDKITVYDTIKIYDTIRSEAKNEVNFGASDTFFKNNNTVKNSVLIIDTATLKAELILFNKNDTATISINSIILLNPIKNLETMKKEILILAAATMLAQPNFAQDANSENKTQDVIPQTKHQLCAGISWQGGKNFGGNFNYAYYISPKLGIGGRLVATDYKFTDYHSTTLHVDYTGGLFYDVSLAANYFLLGNHDGKAGIFVGVGIGYGSARNSTTTWWRTNVPETVSYNTTNTINGLSGNFTLGGTYKAGPGRLFLELNASYIFHGTRTHTETYPNGYSGYPNSGGNWTSRVGVNQVGTVINLGYAFSF